jgi:hypothetical protein
MALDAKIKAPITNIGQLPPHPAIDAGAGYKGRQAHA